MSDVPRPEYPRPQLVRDDWLNLNGEWEFGFDPGLSGEARGWATGTPLPERILVPFCPESELSGIGHTDFMPCVWYRRTVGVPETWRDRRVLLHFGAVDYETTVWVNGRPAGWHRGGYTPFQCEITGLLKPGPNEIVVRAVDDTRSPLQPRGKQCDRYTSYGCLYTRTTGIWQTVWLEAAPQSYVSALRLTPDLSSRTLLVEAQIAGPGGGLRLRATAQAAGEPMGAAEAPAGDPVRLLVPIREVRPWSPDDPFLYDLTVSLESPSGALDTVSSYFGLREVQLANGAICLNGKPLFQRLVLDQGFYPDGIYTAPSDEALRRDVGLSLAVGFNGARLHEKVFEPRFLYWADKLGYLCWGEFPNWGLDHGHPGALARMMPEWLEALERDFSHPAIVGWCPFNETPAEQDETLIRAIYRATKAADKTRPVIDTSGYHHVETDIYDSHNYEQDPEKFAAAFRPLAAGGVAWRNDPDHHCAHAGEPYFVSEYGGTWWHPGQSGEQAWGYGDRPRSEEELVARYRALTETLLFHPRMCAFCYTQLYDIEQEVNGLYTYDRRAKLDPAVFEAINRQRAALED